MSFNSDLKRFTRKVEDNSEKIIRGTALALFRHVILRTPVKTGRLRANWQTTINRPASGTNDNSDKSGAKAIAETATNSNGFKLGQSIYLVNNLPYAQVIEEGRNGNKGSLQAPAGMVRVTITEFEREIAKQARKLK